MLCIIIAAVILVYTLAAINLRLGYRHLLWGGVNPSVREKIAERLKTKGIGVPDWLTRKSKGC